MKNLTIISSILLAVIASNAHAKNFSIGKTLKSQFLANASEAPAPTPPVPIRQAKVRAEISKSILVKNPDGSFDYKTDSICLKEGVFNVYKFDDGVEGVIWPDQDMKQITCPATYNNQPITINIGGVLGIFTNTLLGKIQTIKSIMPMMYLDNPSHPQDQINFLYANVSTRDLNASSFIFSLQPTEAILSCSSSSSDGSSDPSTCTGPNEYFSAVVDIQDQP